MIKDVFQAVYIHNILSEQSCCIIKELFNQDRCEVLKDNKGNSKMVFIHFSDLALSLKELNKPKGLLLIVKHLLRYATDNDIYMFCYTVS